MANPQKENGFTPIANEILEAVCRTGLNGTEHDVVLLLLRKTYGFHKKEDEISLSHFLNYIPVTKPTLCKALKNLQLVKIIKLVKKGKSKNASNKYTFNKNYDEWQLVKKSKLVKKKKRTSKGLETQLVKKPLHTKDSITKETITKEREDTPAQKMREFISSVKKKDESFNKLVFSLKEKVYLQPQEIVAELDKFVSYWTEYNKSGTKQRWELEKTFEVQRRLATWFSRAYKTTTKSLGVFL